MTQAVSIDALASRRSRLREEFEALPIDRAVLGSLLDCSADSVSVIGRDGKTLFITPRGREQFGTANQASVIGQPWLDHWPEGCANVLADALATAVSGQRANRDVRCENERGEASWWEVCFSPWKVGVGADRADLVIAVARDVSDRHAAIERADVLARELHHRVLNMLSMIQAIIRISAKTQCDPANFIDSVEQRVDALARTHALLTSGRLGEVGVRGILGAELAPFDDAGRIMLDGPPAIIQDPTASALCLAIHELTSNAVKYGALSFPEGQLRVTWNFHGGGLQIRWIEFARPGIRIGPAGFGSMLLESLLVDQLCVQRDWRDDGLSATITIALDHDGNFEA